jgi:hypothetical protein
MKNDTPRTDAEGVRFARIIIEWPESGKQKTTELVPADFARQLERELNEAKATIEDWAKDR